MTDFEKLATASSSTVQTVVTPLDPNSKITTIPFNGQNYLKWSQAVELYLKAWGKMGHLDGACYSPFHN